MIIILELMGFTAFSLQQYCTYSISSLTIHVQYVRYSTLTERIPNINADFPVYAHIRIRIPSRTVYLHADSQTDKNSTLEIAEVSAGDPSADMERQLGPRVREHRETNVASISMSTLEYRAAKLSLFERELFGVGKICNLERWMVDFVCLHEYKIYIQDTNHDNATF